PMKIHEEALAFLEDHKDTSFFMFYPSLIPHAELFAPEKYMAKYRGKYLPEKKYEGTDEGERFRIGPYGSQEESHAAFVAMIDLLDEQVGSLMEKIAALGLSENTLIVFTSDNGPHFEGGADPDFFDSNGPLKGYKRDLYEGGIRVPMIAAWPGQIAAGSSSDHVSAFWDMLPTFAELAGATAPQSIDGISIVNTLLGKSEQNTHDYLYWEFHEKGGRLALRQNNWKLVQYNVNKTPQGEFELYDLSKDIGEESNVADEYPEQVATMKALMQQARTDSEVFQFAARSYDAETKQ
ncbi:MAG: sulfatase-like hydrolase/transferase, partial [Bacteroidota bacterium]